MNILPHLMIADGVWRRLGWSAAVRPHILLGGVAPDAHRVMADVGYRSLHFRSNSKVSRRERDFISEYLRPSLQASSQEEQGFWIGWWSHIVADRVWRKLLRQDFPELWSSCLDEDPEAAEEWRDLYQASCDLVDRQITQVTPEYIAELKRVLRASAPEYDVFPVTIQSLNHWVGGLTTSAMPPADPKLREPGPITLEFVQRTIDASLEEVLATVHGELRRVPSAPALQ